MEYKYTTDGKKVVVIGDLNQTEKIVQEIFVTNDGAEIPQGERFTVKSLLDEPAISWKEKQLAELESIYEKGRADWERKIDNINNEKKLIYEALSERVKWLRKVAKEPQHGELKRAIERLADFLSGAETWVLYLGYEWELEKWDEDGVNKILTRIESYGTRNKVDSIRLLSLYGKTDGSLEWGINDYSDGSGSDKQIQFFKTREDAIKCMQAKFDKIEAYNVSRIKDAEKFNLAIDEKKYAEYIDARKRVIMDNISKKEAEISDYREKLEKLEKEV